MNVKYQFIEQEIVYDGSQLRPLFAFQEFGLEGDSIVSWIGPCNVSSEFMKDGEDLVAGESIQGAKMLHFIIEAFGHDLTAMVYCQRLFSSIAKDLIVFYKPDIRLLRDGDDLFLQDKKLNISIASTSAVSSMIHCAFNITNEDTPVKTCSLEDFGLSGFSFSKELMENFVKEFSEVVRATKKVFPLV